jgi:hypothetical protein
MNVDRNDMSQLAATALPIETTVRGKIKKRTDLNAVRELLSGWPIEKVRDAWALVKLGRSAGPTIPVSVERVTMMLENAPDDRGLLVDDIVQADALYTKLADALRYSEIWDFR